MTPGLYRTRSGHKARILCNDAPGRWTVMGYVMVRETDGVQSYPVAWTTSGRSSYISGKISPRDIIGPWEEAA